MHDILKRLLLAWLIYFSWMSVAGACNIPLQDVNVVPENRFEGVPIIINVEFGLTKDHIRTDVSYEVLDSSIRIHVVRIAPCGLSGLAPTRLFSIKANIGILPEGKYSVDVFYRDSVMSEEFKLSSTSLSVLARAEISSIPTLSESNVIILTLLLFLLMAAHRYNYINFTKKLKDS